MISENLTTEKKEKMEFAPLSQDVYQVQLVDISDKLVPEYNDKTKMETVLSFYFVVLEGKATDLKDARGRILARNFVPNYFYEGKNGKNITMQIVEAILGRERTEEEEAFWGSKEWTDLIGKQCRVLIENKEGKDKTVYSNIKSLLPAKQNEAELTDEEMIGITERIEKMEENANKPKEELPEVNPNIVEPEIDIDDIV